MHFRKKEFRLKKLVHSFPGISRIERIHDDNS